jgi:hypothetical protein
MLLLKTHESHMDGVRRNRAHASDGVPRGLSVGDWLLVQVTSGQPGNEVHRVKYAMRFRSCDPDTTGETMRIWGKQWRYLIRGTDFRILRRPFDIERVQVSAANYGQGVIRFAYVDPLDERAIISSDLLAGA